MKKIVTTLFILVINFLSQLSYASDALEQAPPTPKTVFITGGCGFIGSNFVKYMFDRYPEYRFIVLDALTYSGLVENIPGYIRGSDRFEFVKGCVTNIELVDQLMAQSNFVVHFAAETDVTRSIFDDEVFIKSNVHGTRSMLMALVKHSKTVERFIHISSSETYGTATYEPMDEQHPLAPRSPYAAAKAGADMLVCAYACTFDIPIVTIRPFNNYGPNQHLEKMVPRFITLANRGEPIPIQGTGEQTRDWIHTFDVSRALDKTLHHPNFESLKKQVINIGTGQATSVIAIARKILNYLGRPESQMVFIEDRPGQVACHIGDIKKAEALLDWTPSISLERGLEATIDWYTQIGVRG